MADVLIVCVREDEPLAKAFADMFERAGLHVGGAPGAPDDMRSCGAALVVWSQASIRSRAFLDAAQRAVNAGKAVVACLIAPPPPASINHAPAFDLSQWTGDPDDPVLDPLFFAVDRMVAAARAAAGVAAPVSAVARATAEPQTSYFAQTAAPPAAAPPYARARPTATPHAARAPSPRPAPAFDQMQRPAPMRRPAAGPPQEQFRDPDQTAAEAQNWAAIRHSRNPEDFLRHLADFGSEGAFAELAQMKLAELEAEARRRKQTPAGAARQDSMRSQPVRLEPTRPVLPRPEPSTARSEPMPSRGAHARTPPANFEPIQAEQPRPRPQQMPRPPVRRDPPPAWRDEMRAGDVMRRPAPPPRQGGGALRLVAVIAVLCASAVGAGLMMGDRFGSSDPNKESQEAASDSSWDTGPSPREQQIADREAKLMAASSDTPVSSDPEFDRPLPREDRAKVASARNRDDEIGGPVAEREPETPRPRLGPDRLQRDAAATPPPIRLTPSPSSGTVTTSGPLTTQPTTAPPAETQIASVTPAPMPAATRPAVPATRPFVIWASRPGAQRLAEYFPQRALRIRQGGRVELDCLIDTGGVPRCAVHSETPAGFGFGSAAVRASSQYRAAPTLNDGTPSIGAQTRLVISFASPGE